MSWAALRQWWAHPLLWWRWRRFNRNLQELNKQIFPTPEPSSAESFRMPRPTYPIEAPTSVPVLTDAQRAQGFVVKDQSGMLAKVAPVVDEDPWGDEEPTSFYRSGGKD